ncbi:MAG TPA: hypothetical protein PLL24_01315 [Thiobacillaceae bacterium]|nr:hypothetical protein [Thiobacillaceae bacterium]HNI06703.1 hypothetical protein [Thiobacillaceae bacterium]
MLIAGMHRSGTSALTRILSLHGYTLPQTLLEAAKSNETGFWESVPVNRLNDRILASVGASWQSWQPFPNEPANMPGYAGLKQDAKDLLASEFGHAGNFVLKDPRLCRLMPFWLDVLAELGARAFVISPLRNPQETAASLEQRNGLPQPLGQLIWLRYVLDVEMTTRGLPRSMPRYSALLDDWRDAMLKIGRETGLDWTRDTEGVSEAIGAFLSPRHRHHQVVDAVFLHDPAESQWVRDTYAILLKWSAAGEDPADHKALDRIRAEFSAIPAQLEPVLDAGRKSMDEARRLRKKLDSQSSELAGATRQLAQREAEATVYSGRFEQTLARLEIVIRDEGTLEGKAAGLEQHLAAVEKRLGESEQRLASAMQEVARWETEARFKGEQWQESRALQAEQKARLDELSGLVAGLETELSSNARRLEASVRQQKETEAQLGVALDEKARWKAEAGLIGDQLRDGQNLLAERDARLEVLNRQFSELGAQAQSTAQRLAELAEWQEDTEARLGAALREWGRWEADARLQAEQLREGRHQLADRDVRLEELRGSLAGLELVVAEMARSLKDSEQLREDIEAKLGVALKEWGRWEADARLKDEQFRESAERLADREAEVSVLRNQLEEVTHRLAATEAGLASARAEFKRRVEEMSASRKEDVSRLNDKDVELGRAMREISSLKSKLFDGRDKLEKTLRGRDIARRDVQRLRAQLDQVQSSLAWRVSRAFVTVGKGAVRYLTSGPGVSPERRQVGVLENSPLFDRAWYLDQYPQAAGMSMDASLHYLRHGAREGLDPGPGFSTLRYLEKNPDVVREGLNPLLHFEQFGRKEGREIFPSLLAAPEAQPQPDAGGGTSGSDSLPPVHLAQGKAALADETGQASAESLPSWLSLPEIPPGVQAAWVELWGHRLGWVPADPHLANKGLPVELLQSVTLLNRMMDLPEAESLHFDGGVPLPVPFDAGTALDEQASPILVFPGQDVVIESAAFVDDMGLRLRFTSPDIEYGLSRIVRFFQYDPEGGVPVLVGEAELQHKAIEFADLALISAYSPVLATLGGRDGQILSATILPFPSLCMGGRHGPEMLATAEASQGVDGLRGVSRRLLEDFLGCLSGRMAWDVGRVFVDLRGASGAEPIFSRDFREWLVRVMRVDLRPLVVPPGPGYAWLSELLAPQGARDLPRLADGRLGLVCPPDSLPTLHALVAGRGGGGVGRLCAVNSHVVVDRQSGRGLWRVSLPPSMRDWHWAQPDTGALAYPYLENLADRAALPDRPGAGGDAPIAVSRRDRRDRAPASLIYPVAPEIPWPLSETRLAGEGACQGRITVICALDRRDPGDIRALLESLSLQERVVVAQVIVLMEASSDPGQGDPAADLARFFPDAHQVVVMPEGLPFSERSARLADLVPEDGGVLWMCSRVILHDPRTLAVLWEIAREPEVGSAGCLLLRPDPENKHSPVRFASAGWFPVTEQGNARPLQCAELDCLLLLATATYPVAANSDSLALMRAAVWRSLNDQARESAADFRPDGFGVVAVRSGLSHVCTTVVSAELHEPLPPPSRFPAQLEFREPPVDIHETLADTCVSIEVLRG